MAEKDQIIKEKLEHSGIFDFSKLYSNANGWFKDEGYGVSEDKYKEKVSGTARDITFEWKAVKRISDYFKVELGLKVEAEGLTEVEVEIEGKKKKMQKGKITIDIKGTLVRDPESEWDGTPFYRFIRDIYSKYIIPARIDSMEDRVRGDVMSFKEKQKEFLELTGKR